jgi:ABC-type oligopeptide transport system substrate-binding subunit
MDKKIRNFLAAVGVFLALFGVMALPIANAQTTTPTTTATTTPTTTPGAPSTGAGGNVVENLLMGLVVVMALAGMAVGVRNIRNIS